MNKLRKILTYKNRLLIKIFIVLIVAISILIAIYVLILIKKDDQKDSSKQNLNNVPESIAVKTPESHTVKLPEKFKFVNAKNFERETVNSTYLEYCSEPEEKIVSISEIIYTATLNPDSVSVNFNNGRSKIPFYIFTNATKHGSKNKKLMEAYYKVTDLFKGKYSQNNLDKIRSNDIWDLFQYSCPGNYTLPLSHIQTLNYPGTDAAYLLISYDISPYIADPNIPVEITLVAKIEDDYGMSTLYFGKYNDITTENNLTKCETDLPYSNPTKRYISPDGEKCVKKYLLKDLDSSKLDKIVGELLELFKLKS